VTATRAGMRLGGRYRLTERIAFGGMGEVWAGVDEVLGRAVAVKILRPELARDDAFRRRFREEARTAGGLSHPGIAAVYDYGEGTPSEPATPHAPDSDPLGLGPRYGGYDEHEPDWTSGDDVAYLVMELVPGQPLSAILAECGPLPPVRALELVAQAARGLHAAHQRGVVHRDVKPANLMVTPEGRVKVTDFGIARPQDHEPLTATGQVMGTAHYLAPELARGHLATPSSDIYALGVVAYECVAGRRPFEGDNQVAVATAHLSEEPPALPPELPADVRRVITTAMQKEADYRFVSADAFAEVLDFVRFRLLAGDPTPVWANRGPVPGVGAMRVPGSPRTPGSGGAGGAPGYLTGAGTGAGAGTGRGNGTPQGVGRGATEFLGGASGTAALPLGRRAARAGVDANGRPRSGSRTSLTPILAGVGLIVLVGALIVGFTMINRSGNEKGSGTTPPAPTTTTSSQPAVSILTPGSTTSSRSIFTSHRATSSGTGTRTSTATSTATGTGTKTTTTNPTTPTPTTTTSATLPTPSTTATP
jgi:serine/threonine protein kinase